MTLRQRGFSLLEAMVAMVILGSAGMALFSWVNASIASLRRVEDANARSAATLNALEYMQSVNPMLRPEGRIDLGTFELAWRAERSGAFADGVNYPRGLGDYQLALYDTQVRAYRADAQEWFELKLTLVGYKRVRQSINIFAK